MDVRKEIMAVIRQVADESGKELADGFGNDSVLLQSGLDSLDFAIIVARLEEKLNADPFSVMEEPIYPRTLADFVGIYEGYFSHGTDEQHRLSARAVEPCGTRTRNLVRAGPGQRLRARCRQVCRHERRCARTSSGQACRIVCRQ